MKIRIACIIIFAFVVRAAVAADHRVEPLAEAAPADALSPDIAAQLNTEGVRVIRGSNRVICDIWTCKEWPVEAFEAGELLYPLAPGQLIGVVRYPRKGADFRDQPIADGVYTLRYAHQPVDGAHVGTSPTRDFLLLVPAAEDKTVDKIDPKQLAQLSTKASGTSHPSLLSLQKVEGDMAVRNVADKDWWIVRLNGNATSNGESRPLPLDLVVVGQAVSG